MSEVKSLFREYLSAIEPDTKAKNIAAKSHIQSREYLETDEEIGDSIQDSFLYGSYRRHTAIHDIKDVDIVMISSFDPDDDTPSTVLNKLHAALERCYGNENVLKLNRRSVCVTNPLPDEKTDLTLDVLPAVEVNDGSGYLLVPDRDQKDWILTNPRGHIDAISKANIESGRTLVPMVKIMKAWWHYQSALIANSEDKKLRPKGFWLETLVLTHFDATQDSWAKRFIKLLKEIDEAYPQGSDVPELRDPGMPETILETSMTKAEFGTFMKAVRVALGLAYAAFNEEDRHASSQTWAQIFGDDFPVEEESEKQKFLTGKQYSLGSINHAVDLNLPYFLHGRARLYAELYRRSYDNPRQKVRYGDLSSHDSIRNGLHIKFRAWTDVKRPFSVYWRVVNTGSHAANKNGLRGKPFLDNTGMDLGRWEPTEYTGKHWMECFIVKDDEVVAASERYYINITNPEWIG